MNKKSGMYEYENIFSSGFLARSELANIVNYIQREIGAHTAFEIPPHVYIAEKLPRQNITAEDIDFHLGRQRVRISGLFIEKDIIEELIGEEALLEIIKESAKSELSFHNRALFQRDPYETKSP